MKIYRINSEPLERVVDFNTKDYYYTEAGDCIQFINTDTFTYNVIHTSVLVPNEDMTDLTQRQLNLFWILSKKELSKFKGYEFTL